MAPDPGRVYSVGELSAQVRDLLEGSFGRVSVRGEVTNLSRPRSGHVYFSLVDDETGPEASRFATPQLPAVIWRSSAGRMRFRLDSGMKVVATGRLAVYAPRGTYQIIVDRLVPAGVGELQLAFEQLKSRLAEEGLFASERKRPLPRFPRQIGLVTSPSGAAIRDFLRVVYRRWPGAWVRVIPVPVQGEGAAAGIAAAIDRFQQPDAEIDVLVLARGGGSLEDLWAFNEEIVARALARSRVPTVSGVGHEVDFTIADLVADVRAATPTAAGEVVVAEEEELREALRRARRRAQLALGRRLDRAREALLRVTRSRLWRDPQVIVQERFEQLDRASSTLENTLYNHLRRWDDALFTSAARLEGVNPLSVLARGYSVTTTSRGEVVKSASRLQPGDAITVRFAQGRARAVVDELEDLESAE